MPWPAFAAAINGNQPQVLALGGTKVHVEAGIDRTAVPSSVLELMADDGRAARIEDPFNSLLLEDRDARLDAYRQHREWLDLPSAKFAARAQEIVDIDDVAKRMASALDERDRSMAWRYRVLAQRIVDRPSFKVRDLIPPSEGALLRHLRISGDGDFKELWDSAARDLIDNDGLDEAFLRLSGVPVPLPAAFLASVDQLDGDALRGSLNRWRHIPSPMSQIHALRVAHYARSRLEPGELRPYIDAVLDCGLKKGALDALLATLLAVHGWCHHWRVTDSWAPSKHLAACWGHAHRILIALRSSGADVAWIAEEFRRRATAARTDLFSAAWDYRDDIAHPHSVNLLMVLIHGLAYAVDEEPLNVFRDDQVARVRSLFTQSLRDGQSILALPLMRDETRATNLLGSFLVTNFHGLLASVVGAELASPASAGAAEQQTLEVVRSLGSDTITWHLWIFLSELVGDRPASPSLARELAQALRKTPIPFDKDEALPQIAGALRFVCMQAGRLQNPDLMASTREWLRTLAEQLPASGEAIDPRTYSLLNACLYLAQSGSPENIASQFVENVRSLACCSPVILRAARKVLPGLCRDLPLSIGHKLWPLLIEARCAL
jgi:hypothetical protein